MKKIPYTLIQAIIAVSDFHSLFHLLPNLYSFPLPFGLFFFMPFSFSIFIKSFLLARLELRNVFFSLKREKTFVRVFPSLERGDSEWIIDFLLLFFTEWFVWLDVCCVDNKSTENFFIKRRRDCRLEVNLANYRLESSLTPRLNENRTSA